MSMDAAILSFGYSRVIHVLPKKHKVVKIYFYHKDLSCTFSIPLCSLTGDIRKLVHQNDHHSHCPDHSTIALRCTFHSGN